MARILIVDDEPMNRTLLEAYFDGHGHELDFAASGEEALVRAVRVPDLILLDVMMPGIDGFETARQLRLLGGDHLFVPIVLVTALDDQASRLRGLEAGANDFLTKPLDRHELLVRVKNLLALRAHERMLAQRNLELAELSRFRDEMTKLIVHDLKNPLAVVRMNLGYLLREIETATDEQRDALSDAELCSRRLERLLANLLDVTSVEAGRLALQPTSLRLRDLLGGAIHERQLLARSREIHMEIDIAAELEVSVDADLIARVIENVLDNALRHTTYGGRIAVHAGRVGPRIELRIGNTGAPVPVEARATIFEKFAQAGGTGRMNLGLGLYFCRLAIEAHGGRIWVEETRELPTVFAVDLPAEPRTAA